MNIGNATKAAKLVVTSKVGRQLLLGKKHSPTILFGVGVIGVVTSTVMASKATLKLEEIVTQNEIKQEEANELARTRPADYSAKDQRKDLAVLRVRFVKDISRLYGPAFVVGAASICALGGSHVILTKRNAGLMAAYATLDKAFAQYRERVTDHYGKDVDKQLMFGSKPHEIVSEGEHGPEVTTINKAEGPSLYAKFFSKDTSKSWSPQSEYNIVFLKSVQTYANDKLQGNGHVLLNDVYDDLGMERTSAGCVVGWVKNNGDNYVDFGIFDNPDRFHDFMIGREGAILLDFNVDGVVYDKI